MLLRTAKPCGPGTRCWCQVGGGASAQPGLDKPYSADDGDKTNSSPGRARNKPLKPLRAGMPGVPVDLWWLHSCALPHFAHEAAGAAGTRHSPRPLLGERFMHNSGASRRGNANARLKLFWLLKIESME